MAPAPPAVRTFSHGMAASNSCRYIAARSFPSKGAAWRRRFSLARAHKRWGRDITASLTDSVVRNGSLRSEPPLGALSRVESNRLGAWRETRLIAIQCPLDNWPSTVDREIGRLSRGVIYRTNTSRPLARVDDNHV